MIAKISGTLAYKAPGEIIVDVGGVGYQLLISLTVFYRLPEIGKSVALYVYTHVREDALQLFGFVEPGEKQLFLHLIGVAGIGPRLALNILSGIPADDLARALKEGDQGRLQAIPGVGRKLAERMSVELRDKLTTMPICEEARGHDSELIRDVLSALVNLGYRPAETERTVRQVIQEGKKP
ncbi:MAG: Holliday junction branch migration protein RuvA, partial [Candidatus Binatia bacterium]